MSSTQPDRAAKPSATAIPAPNAVPADAVPTDTMPAPGGTPAPTPETAEKHRRLDPTRYGDWELKGRCIDF